MRYNEVMIVTDILVWWYTEGWRQRYVGLRERLEGVIDYFSIGLLLRTLFAPFRQISAGQVNGPIGVQIRAFFDRLVSRLIGAAVRLVIIGIGTLAIGLSLLADGLLLAVWALVPLLPLLGLALFLLGWMPWSR